MIEIESKIMDACYRGLMVKYPTLTLSNEEVSGEAEFPFLLVNEISNAVYRKTQDSGSIENHAVIIIEAQAYSNLRSGGEHQVREIIADTDEILARMGFTRMDNRPLHNLPDPTIKRRVARWRGVVSKELVVHRR